MKMRACRIYGVFLERRVATTISPFIKESRRWLATEDTWARAILHLPRNLKRWFSMTFLAISKISWICATFRTYEELSWSIAGMTLRVVEILVFLLVFPSLGSREATRCLQCPWKPANRWRMGPVFPSGLKQLSGLWGQIRRTWACGL